MRFLFQMLLNLDSQGVKSRRRKKKKDPNDYLRHAFTLPNDTILNLNRYIYKHTRQSSLLRSGATSPHARAHTQNRSKPLQVFFKNGQDRFLVLFFLREYFENIKRIKLEASLAYRIFRFVALPGHQYHVIHPSGLNIREEPKPFASVVGYVRM